MVRHHSKWRKVWHLIEPYWARCYSLATAPPDLTRLHRIVMLGNQKTGSTAIAHLLARYGQLSITSDVPTSPFEDTPTTSSTEMVRFIKQHHYYFRRDVIKDNTLTFACGALLSALPAAQFVYISRHPVQNIRSILDRLNLPGSPQPVADLHVESGWNSILTNQGLGLTAEDHITAMAKRWARATELFHQYRNEFTLIRYEDFMADKKTAITDLASTLNVAKRGDIDPYLDVSFQRRGAHRDTQPTDFFDQDALAIIHEICGEAMTWLNYEPIVE